MDNRFLFGSKLRELRQGSEKTIDEICLSTGFSKSYLMDLESGRSRPPRIVVIKLLAECFGLDKDKTIDLVKTAILSSGRVVIQPEKGWGDEDKLTFAATIWLYWDLFGVSPSITNFFDCSISSN